VRRLLGAPLQFRDRTLPSLTEADAVALERGPRKVTFAKVDGSWKVTEPLPAAAEHDGLEDFVNALTHLRADAWVAEKPADLKVYGLDPPQARWRFRLGGKDVLDLWIGSPEKPSGPDHLASGARCYARLVTPTRPRLEAAALVAVAPAAAFPASIPWVALGGAYRETTSGPSDLVFLLDPKTSTLAQGEYRDRTLWTALEPNQVESITFSGGRDRFTLKKMNETWHLMGKPEPPISTPAVTETLEALGKLRVERYVVDKDANLKEYGLDPPRRTIEVQTRAGGKYVLLLGNQEKDTKRTYAHLPQQGGRTDVFVLAEADMARIARDLPAFLQSAPGLPPPPPVKPGMEP
jgi:hypothetical protein